MAKPDATALTVGQLLQVIRYELRMPVDEMARRCRLCPCCYERIEQDDVDSFSADELDALADSLPGLSDLIRGLSTPGLTPGDDEAGRFLSRIADLENLPPAQRDIAFARMRLELGWLDGR